jgi:hypothetical protein
MTTLKLRCGLANEALRKDPDAYPKTPVWRGTGEVGTTLGKESRNAEITIVI